MKLSKDDLVYLIFVTKEDIETLHENVKYAHLNDQDIAFAQDELEHAEYILRRLEEEYENCR